MLMLRLYHGRFDPDEEKDDWGFDGPSLIDIVQVKFTYATVSLWFRNVESMRIAQKQTGWQCYVDDASLQMQIYDDLVQCFHIGERGSVFQAYYGDWILTDEIPL